MKKIFKNNFNNSLAVLLIFLMITGWIFSGWPQIFNFPPKIEQVAATDIVLVNTTTANGGNDRITQLTVNKPTGQDNDVFIAHFSTDGDNVAASVPAGWIEIFQTDDTKDIYSAAWYKVITDYSGEGANYTWTFTSSESITGAIMNFRGVDTSNPINVSSSGVGSSINPTSPEVETTVVNALVLRVFGCDTSDAQNGAGYPADNTGIYSFNDSADDNGQGAAYKIQTNAGLTGTAAFTLLNSDQWVAGTIAIAPVPPTTTTIADGTDPGNSTVAPESGITDLNAFTLIATSGTDTVIAATVTLGPADAFNNIYQADITNDSNVAQCTAINNPASNTLSFTDCTIPVTDSAVTFKVRITPKTHANMDAPATGASYDTTGTVTAFTCTNSQLGTDTDSATITIDNASTANSTDNGGTASDAQVTINYTTPADADLHSVIVLRDTSAVSNNPVEGTVYAVGNTIGTATVACVDTGVAVSTADSCSDTDVVNDTAYHYEIFVKDSNGNYSTGAVPADSPFTPTATSLTFIVSTDDFPAGGITPGTPIFATSTISVDTDNSAGWYVTLERADADTTMDLDTDPAINIPDPANEWSVGASAATSTGGNASTITSGDDGLYFRVMTASGSPKFWAGWWGTDDTPFTNAKWAGIASTTNLSKIGRTMDSSGGSAALNTVQYYIDVSVNQEMGTYTGDLTFTATMNP